MSSGNITLKLLKIIEGGLKFLSVTFSISVYLSIFVWLYSHCGPWPLAELLGGGLVRRKAATYTQNNTNTINAHRLPCF
jgi:hypothetical protein